MRTFLLLTILILGIVSPCISQTSTADSVITGDLEEVIVKAFEQTGKLKDVPAAVSYFTRSTLSRYNNTNILPALNAAPGIRMEERSPGSYRLNIRGSSLRSPFGVRNVKVYYNNIPLTDPGGNTYLNQLGFYNFQSIEIIKGPGSSIYGAGSGGVMLIESTAANWTPGYNVDYSTGSYDLQNISSSVRLGSGNLQNTITYQHQTGSGYREQSAMRRDIFSWNAVAKGTGKNQLAANFLYGDLYYQTPGPLTLAEYNANPKAARPRAGALPGSVESKATIYQKTFLAGATLTHEFNQHWQNTSTVYAAFTQVKNPTIRNYGRSNEPHFGGRSMLQYKRTLGQSVLTWHAGGELQQGITTAQAYKNVNGNPDSLQTNDEIDTRTAFVFSQLSLQTGDWIFTGGISLNQLKVKLTRLSVFPVQAQNRKYNNELAPRLAVLRKLTGNISFYTSVSKGFSPPTSAEVLPSTGVINTALNAENGINYEAGLKGNAVKGKLSFDINAFFFGLHNAIVQRRDVTGGDYFINAGSTKQNGLESYLSYQPVRQTVTSLLSSAKFWLSHTWNNFHYKDFKQVNNNFSGNQLPSTAPHIIAAGIDLISRQKIYLNLTYYYSDPIPLNDANTDRASSYNLLAARAGFKKSMKGYNFEIFAGADNIFNVKYSLGNDINGFGGRYYNAAMPRNFFAGLSFGFSKEK